MPQSVKDEGEQAVKLFQTALLYGMSQEQARAFIQTEKFQQLLARRQNWETVRAALGDKALPTAKMAMAIMSGEQLVFDANDQQWYVKTDCSTLGASDLCRIPLAQLKGFDRARLNELVDEMFTTIQRADISPVELVASLADTLGSRTPTTWSSSPASCWPRRG